MDKWASKGLNFFSSKGMIVSYGSAWAIVFGLVISFVAQCFGGEIRNPIESGGITLFWAGIVLFIISATLNIFRTNKV